MSAKRKPGNPHTEYHKDGNIRAQGRMAGVVSIGYWEWFRLNGTRMQSGHFDRGRQVGEWITYDRMGQKYKVTNMNSKPK
jgi:antitoxin component YwqK of YwqJK toxin-antitoxin module